MLSTAAVELSFALLYAAKVEPNGLNSTLTDVPGASRDDFIFHGSAKERVRMADDCGA